MVASKDIAVTEDPARLVMCEVKEGAGDQIAILLLNRSESANALSPDLMSSITKHLKMVQQNPRCRLLILGARGKHFSAGADLNWMKASAALSHKDNIDDACKLTEMFESLANASIPTIGVVRGAAYGGAVGLAACCDIGIAIDTAKFCLSEARLGIAPAVIMPYLARKMHPGPLRRLALSAQIFSGVDAKDHGLVELTCNESQLDALIRQEVNALLACGPKAQARIKNLLNDVRLQGCRQGNYTAEAIAGLRTSSEGQDGLAAFFTKAQPPWSLAVSETWSFNALCS